LQPINQKFPLFCRNPLPNLAAGCPGGAICAYTKPPTRCVALVVSSNARQNRMVVAARSSATG
jgi:hypothetical protein